MRESPPSKSRLSCSRLLAPRMQSGLHRSSRPSLQSCAPASSPHRLTLWDSDCTHYSDSREQEGAWISPAARSLAPSLRLLR